MNSYRKYTIRISNRKAVMESLLQECFHLVRTGRIVRKSCYEEL